MKLLKSSITIVVLLLAGIALVVLFNLNYEDEMMVDQLGFDQGSVASVTEKITRIKSADQKISKKPTAKVFYESIAKTPAPEISNVIVGQEYAESLKTALAGDLGMAVEISNLQGKCDALILQEKMLDKATIVNTGQMSEDEIDQKYIIVKNRKYKKFERERKQCMDAFNGDYESDLGKLARHGDLYQQALAGNVMAKYMYAVQNHSDPYLTELFILGIDFSEVALTFTNENLIERPDLGLLAYGQSYTAGGRFTPLRISVGMAYFIAAGICGADTEVLNSFPIFKILSTNVTDSFLAPLEKILTLADTLSQQYCPL